MHDAFRDLFESVGEILPIVVENTEHYALNVLRRVDALDLELSEVRTFYADKIAAIDRHVFRPDCVSEESIFLIKQEASVLYTLSGQTVREKDFRAGLSKIP